MNPNDLRVQRTKRSLHTALVELMAEKEYDRITIREITNSAQVGYKTFFRHHESKQSLFLAVLTDLLADFSSQLLPPSHPEAQFKNTVHALQFAADNQIPVSAIFSYPFTNEMLQPLIELGMSEGERTFTNPRIPRRLAAHHFVTSMISLIKWWLDEGMPHSQVEMAKYIDTILLEPLRESD